MNYLIVQSLSWQRKRLLVAASSYFLSHGMTSLTLNDKPSEWSSVKFYKIDVWPGGNFCAMWSWSTPLNLGDDHQLWHATFTGLSATLLTDCRELKAESSRKQEAGCFKSWKFETGMFLDSFLSRWSLSPESKENRFPSVLCCVLCAVCCTVFDSVRLQSLGPSLIIPIP